MSRATAFRTVCVQEPRARKLGLTSLTELLQLFFGCLVARLAKVESLLSSPLFVSLEASVLLVDISPNRKQCFIVLAIGFDQFSGEFLYKVLVRLSPDLLLEDLELLGIELRVSDPSHGFLNALVSHSVVV